MLALPNVFHFFAHKLARLSGRRLAFALIFARAFNYVFFWHNKMISPLERCLAVNNKETGVTSRRFVVSKEPVLSSTWLIGALTVLAAIWTETPIGLMVGCLIRQNPTGHAIT
jgi:hypothetical protein